MLQAEKLMIESEENKEYLPIEGLAAFNKATAELLLGSDNSVIKEVAGMLGHINCIYIVAIICPCTSAY